MVYRWAVAHVNGESFILNSNRDQVGVDTGKQFPGRPLLCIREALNWEPSMPSNLHFIDKLVNWTLDARHRVMTRSLGRRAGKAVSD
jgi:hypothetical protein